MRSLIVQAKKLLWWLNFWPDRCPYCGGALTESGFAKHYTCSFEACQFNQ